MPRLFLEVLIIAAIVYGIFWLCSRGTPAQNRKLLKLVARLAVGCVLAVAIAGGVAYGLTLLNRVF